MAKYELVVTSDNVLSSPLTLTVLDIVGPRGEAGPQGPSGPAGATTLSGLTDVDTDSATIGQLLQADGDDTYSFVTVAGATNTLDDVTSNNNTTTNDISVGGVTATSLNTHTIPGGTGTLALSSDIPTVPTNNNQLTNGAGYITDYTVTQGDVTAHQAALSITESQVSDLGTYLTAETNDLSSAVTWANVPDANVTQSSVTQHQAALSITESQVSDLQSYITGYTVTESDVTAHQAALSITESQISDHGTYATLVGGTVPASQLPSYVDDVEEYATYAGFPGTGEAGKIYVDIATGDIYRWSGSGYVQVNDAVSSADQATRLATARTISLGGDVTGSASFDGTANITITAAVADDSHDHTIANVDGLQTALDGKLASTSTTDNITEGSSNLYYTDARANSAFDIRIATKDTDDLSEGSTNLYYTNARFDTQLATKDTGDLTEGTNLYYTDARVLTKINATSIDALNDVDTTTATPSDGQVLTWDNTAGYWKPSTVSGGGGGGSGDITSVVAGSGLTGGASTGDATLNVGAGSFITVAADTVAVDATDANTASKVVARDASGNFSASTITASLTGNVTGTVSDVSNHDTDDITEGSTNLYYTDARFNTAFSGKSTSDLSEGTNLYYTNARADARVAAATGVNLDLTNQDTDDLSEGSTNLYYTDTRANAAIDARVDEDFINALNVDAASADTLTFTVKNSTGATLEKGSVVYVSGLNGNTPEVSLARANSSSTMPAFGLVGAEIVNTADGTVDTFGSLTGLDVADFGETGITFSLGDTVYVSSSEAGKLTNVAPSGEANLIQNIGKIERATPTTSMTIKVGGAGRTNATPNLNDGNIFIGDSNNKAVTSGLDSEVRSRVSATDVGGDGSFSYDSGTGVFTYTGPSAAEVRAHLSAGGDLSYDSATGIMSFTERTDAEVRGLVSVSGDLSYNSTTGVFSFTERTASEILADLKTVDGAASGLDADLLDGQHGSYYLDWTNTTNKPDPTITLGGDLSGSVTLTDLASGTLNATIAADSVALGTDTTGNYVADVDGTANQIDVSYTPSEGGTPTIGLATNVTTPGNLTVSGNLTVNGLTTTIDSTTVAVADSLFKLAKDNTADSLDAGWYGVYNDGTEKYAGIARDASDSGKFILYDGLQVEPTTTVNTAGTGFNKATLKADIEGDVTGNVTGTVSSLSNHDTGDLAEGTNLYYTDARADARVNLQTGANLDLSSKSTTNLSEGTNLYYTQARFDTAFGNKNTSDLSEGTNLYYTDARADARVNLQTGTNLDLSSKSTTDLSEGTNLYYTDARVDGHLNQSNPTDGYVLSWTNNDYAWVAQSGGSGSIQSEEFPTVTNGSANVTMSQSYALTHIEVYLNGVKLRGGASNDYDVSGTTLTFSENLQSGDVVCVVSLESASTFTISGTFANLTDTSVGSQASNTLIKYNGSAYVPTSLSEDSSGNVTSLVAGDSGNVSVDIRKANVRTTTGTVDLVGGASLYNAGAAATYSCANLNKGDIVTVYAAAASVAVVPGASTSLFKDGNDITGTSETSVAIGQHTIATITMISDTVAIIAGSGLT